MNQQDHPLDKLLKRQTEQHLQLVDWQQLHVSTMNRIAIVTPVQPGRWHGWRLIAACAAAVLVAAVLWQGRPSRSPSILDQIKSGQLSVGAMRPPVEILLRTDPETILLAESVYAMRNDPLLQPISIWDQSEASVSNLMNERMRK